MENYKEISHHTLSGLVEKMNELAKQGYRLMGWQQTGGGVTGSLKYEALMAQTSCKHTNNNPKPLLKGWEYLTIDLESEEEEQEILDERGELGWELIGIISLHGCRRVYFKREIIELSVPPMTTERPV